MQPYMVVDDSGAEQYSTRLLLGTAATGLVRMEWVAARYGQTIPMNWSNVAYTQFINSYIPLRYQVADAQNMIVKAAIEGNFEWLILYEHDVIPPVNAFLRLNEYMMREDTPVVSGLYFNRARPSYPLVFRGRGNGVYTDWEIGDLVWCDGVPTGLLLIHMGILREMWKDSEEYECYGTKTRRVFMTPNHSWFNPDNPGEFLTTSGTSDLNWCERVMKGGYFGKAGWHDYEGKEHPFLVDTQIFCKHINPDGEQFP